MSQPKLDLFYYRILGVLDDLLYRYGIPLLICRSYGMIGYIRIVAQSHTGEVKAVE